VAAALTDGFRRVKKPHLLSSFLRNTSVSRPARLAAIWATCLTLVAVAGVQLRAQQTPLRKIYELDLAIRSLSATVEPTLVLPKAVHGGVRVTLRTGSREVSVTDAARMFGGDVHVEGELSGPGLPQTLTLPRPLEAGEAPLPGDNDPLLLRLPPLPTAGDYTLANLRLVRGTRTVLDVTPRQIDIQVIDEILITSVKTRPLTLDEIRQRGIVLDSDDYLGFEFTLAMKLESTPVNVTFPVVFDRQNIPIPELLRPPSVSREGVLLPTIVPVMLEPDFGDGSGPGEKIPLTPEEFAEAKIPGILVIPGNVGYLKQFFSAQLFVANGAPDGSRLVVHDVTGTIELPKGSCRTSGAG
jgi:hypothetical protein